MRATLCTLALLLAVSASAQPPPQQDGLFLEMGGHGGMFTVSYEREVGPVIPRLGLGLSPMGVHVPALVSHRFGDGRGRLSAGAGAVFMIAAPEQEFSSPVWPAATLGYRFDLPNAPLALRAEFTPFWMPGDDLAAWIGLGVGVSFDRRHVHRNR